MAEAMSGAELATKADLAAVRADLAALKADFEARIDALRAEFKAENALVRRDLELLRRGSPNAARRRARSGIPGCPAACRTGSGPARPTASNPV
jgi:hypothetical protein